MGLDIYAGTLTRYYSHNWKTVVQQWAEENGYSFNRITPDGEPADDEELSPTDVQAAVERAVRECAQVNDAVSVQAIAMDVNRGPLERAREHIAQYQMGDYIETRLSDGLHALRAGEGDSLLIAGMGGGLTVRILSEGEPLLSGFRELILEPQSDIDRVRAWLLEHGFFLAQENFVEEDGKYYPILRAVPGEKENLKAEELFYGPRLLEKENPVLREYLLKQQEQNQTLIRQLSDHSSEKAAQRLWELKEKEAVLESALARFHTM